MPQLSVLSGVLGAPTAQNPAVVYDKTWFFADGSSNVTAQSFTVTNTNNTVAVGNAGGRPALIVTDGNTGATDKTTYFGVVASILPQANYVQRLRLSVYMTTATMDFACGFGVVGTDPIGTDPTNFIEIRKLSADTVFSVRCRKASGTAFIVALNMPSIVASQWYDLELIAYQNTGQAAGNGQVVANWSTNSAAMLNGVNANVIGQFPDTVAMAPFWAQRAGATDAATAAVGYLSAQVEYPGVHA